MVGGFPTDVRHKKKQKNIVNVCAGLSDSGQTPRACCLDNDKETKVLKWLIVVFGRGVDQ